MRIEIERGSRTLGEANATRARVFDARESGLVYVIAVHLFDDNGVDFGEELLICMEPVA